MKILVLTAFDADATYFYRLKPLFYIDNPRIKVERKAYMGQISYSFFDGYDVLVLERPSGVQDLHVIKLAKQCGLKIICDYDDDILHVPEMNQMYHTYESAKQTICECIAESDEVWVSTQGVKRSFVLLNKNIQVVPNCHNDYLQKLEDKKPFNLTEKKAIWRGGSSHQADVYEKAEFIVEKVHHFREYMFYFLGDRFIWMEQRSGNNYQPVSQMPLMQYFDYIHKLNCQIQFHPLSDNIFNKSKSNISFIEGTYAGSAFFGNKNLPEFNHDCIFSFDDLMNNLDVKDMESANILAWEYICDNLLLSNVNKVREERLLNL